MTETTLVYSDPDGRHTIAVLGSNGWVEVWDNDTGEPGAYKVLLDVPTKESSVGVVHRPVMVVGDDWRRCVRQLLSATQHDADEAIERLGVRWRS